MSRFIINLLWQFALPGLVLLFFAYRDRSDGKPDYVVPWLLFAAIIGAAWTMPIATQSRIARSPSPCRCGSGPGWRSPAFCCIASESSRSGGSVGRGGGAGPSYRRLVRRGDHHGEGPPSTSAAIRRRPRLVGTSAARRMVAKRGRPARYGSAIGGPSARSARRRGWRRARHAQRSRH